MSNPIRDAIIHGNRLLDISPWDRFRTTFSLADGKLGILIGRKRIKGIVKFSERITLTVSCYMDLAFYPFDYQTCPIHLVMVLSWTPRTVCGSTDFMDRRVLNKLRKEPKKLHLDFQQVCWSFPGIIRIQIMNLFKKIKILNCLISRKFKKVLALTVRTLLWHIQKSKY